MSCLKDDFYVIILAISQYQLNLKILFIIDTILYCLRDLPSEIALGSSKELTGTVGTVFTKFTIYNEIDHMNSIIL